MPLASRRRYSNCCWMPCDRRMRSSSAPIGRTVAEELARPTADLVVGVGVATTQAVGKIGLARATVVDRKRRARSRGREVRGIRRRVLDADDAFEAEFGRLIGKLGDGHVVAEGIAVETQAAGFGRDPECRIDDLLIVRIARPQHHPVLAKGDRMTVAIGRDVPNGQRWHDGSPIPTKHVSRHRETAARLAAHKLGKGIVRAAGTVDDRPTGGQHARTRDRHDRRGAAERRGHGPYHQGRDLAAISASHTPRRMTRRASTWRWLATPPPRPRASSSRSMRPITPSGWAS